MQFSWYTCLFNASQLYDENPWNIKSVHIPFHNTNKFFIRFIDVVAEIEKVWSFQSALLLIDLDNAWD